MIRTKLLVSKLFARQKHYQVEIVLENENIIARKYEMMAGIPIPIDEQLALDFDTALQIRAVWFIQICGYSLN